MSDGKWDFSMHIIIMEVLVMESSKCMSEVNSSLHTRVVDISCGLARVVKLILIVGKVARRPVYSRNLTPAALVCVENAT